MSDLVTIKIRSENKAKGKRQEGWRAERGGAEEGWKGQEPGEVRRDGRGGQTEKRRKKKSRGDKISRLHGHF